MGFQYPFSLPLLQGIGCPAYQLTELFGRICVVHTYILTHFNMFVNIVHRLLSAFALDLCGLGVYPFPQGAAGALSFHDPLEGTEINSNGDVAKW